jgi:UDPglucose 6-dehydrogenase
MVEKIRAALGGGVAGRRIAVLGLAFKADTDDMRNAPALTILPPLVAEGAEVRAYDPAAAATARALLPDVTLAESAAAAVAGADAAVILTEWAAFRTLPWKTLAATMRRPLVVDLRNLYDPAEMQAEGVDYVALGRPDADLAYRAAAE